jgi:hypothetical protein
VSCRRRDEGKGNIDVYSSTFVCGMEAEVPPKLSITIVQKRLRGWNRNGRTVATYLTCTFFQSMQNSRLKIETQGEHKQGSSKLDEVV